MDESRDRLHSTFSVNDWAHGPIAACPIEASLRRGGATTRSTTRKREEGGEERERALLETWGRRCARARALFLRLCGPKNRAFNFFRKKRTNQFSSPLFRSFVFLAPIRSGTTRYISIFDIDIRFLPNFRSKISFVDRDKWNEKHGRIVFALVIWEKGDRGENSVLVNHLNQKFLGIGGFFFRKAVERYMGGARGIGAARDLCRFSERRMLLSKM